MSANRTAAAARKVDEHSAAKLDTAERAARRSRILALQRARRSKLRRIDYYPSEAAAAIIEKLCAPGVGGDASSIVNRIIAEWAAGCGAK